MATMNGFVHFNNYLILMSHGKNTIQVWNSRGWII